MPAGFEVCFLDYGDHVLQAFRGQECPRHTNL